MDSLFDKGVDLHYSNKNSQWKQHSNTARRLWTHCSRGHRFGKTAHLRYGKCSEQTKIGYTMAQAVSCTAQSMWNLWWTKRHWDRFSSSLFCISPDSITSPVLHTYLPFCHKCYKIVTIWGIIKYCLTLKPLTWNIWWAPNNTSRWQMGFNSVFKGLNKYSHSACYKIVTIWGIIRYCLNKYSHSAHEVTKP